MKGITPVVATILLLLIAIAMVGFASTFFMSTGQQAQQQGEEELRNLQKTISIIATLPSTNSIAVQYQIGQANIGNADNIKAYITKAPTREIIVSSTPQQISGNANSLQTTTAFACTPGDQVQIIIKGSSGKEYATSGIVTCPGTVTQPPPTSSSSSSSSSGGSQPTVPGAPTSLTASAGTNSISLSWTAPASNGGSAIQKYRVYRSTSSPANTYIAEPSTITYVDAVAAGTYYYRITALNAYGESAFSNEASATIQAIGGASTFTCGAWAPNRDLNSVISTSTGVQLSDNSCQTWCAQQAQSLQAGTYYCGRDSNRCRFANVIWGSSSSANDRATSCTKS